MGQWTAIHRYDSLTVFPIYSTIVFLYNDSLRMIESNGDAAVVFFTGFLELFVKWF